MRPIQVVRMAGSGGSGPAFYLDELATVPRCVLSLRRLISTASLSIRVRRDSDNAEQDILLDSNDELDTASLASFVGANSAFVVTFYDQTGNGEHATNATAAQQPRIVNAGSYLGFLEFDGSNDILQITSLTLGTAYVGLYAKWEQATNTSVKALVESTVDYLNNADSFICYEYSPQGGMVGASHDTGGAVRGNAFTNAAGQAQWTLLYDRTLTGTDEIKSWRDGSALTPTAVGSDEQTGTFATNNVFIGARSGPTLVSTLKLETLCIYNADTSSIRANIEAIVA